MNLQMNRLGLFRRLRLDKVSYSAPLLRVRQMKRVAFGPTLIWMQVRINQSRSEPTLPK